LVQRLAVRAERRAGPFLALAEPGLDALNLEGERMQSGALGDLERPIHGRRRALELPESRLTDTRLEVIVGADIGRHVLLEFFAAAPVALEANAIAPGRGAMHELDECVGRDVVCPAP